MSWLTRLAAQAAVPVYPCIGPGMLAPVERLFLSPYLRRAATPRAAAILLVAGQIPPRAQAALDRVHDQLPQPRASLTWDGAGDPTAELRRLWRELLAGRGDQPDQLPDTPPNEWRGKGDHGQGGKGMMGGVPYGRPMAMTAKDLRDGLELDAYTARFGPFAPMLPPGLEVEITLQGDVITKLTPCAPPFDQGPDASAPSACAARLLHLLGLPLDARRVLEGRRPFGRARLRALPPGLGEVAPDNDARARLKSWLAGRDVDMEIPPLPDLLTGLEWHEAMLVLNSFPPDALRRACLEEAEV
ncbi:hypothetical protein [Paracoccus jeotgali]|uniref:hypothetical protein n=1 Tax=Paracoccus jeotgali TaxID=2065379 RepID=UPI0028B152D6|nr:hypothetical protein [Paracoccus jeotgali]